jgi:hypothetical protein
MKILSRALFLSACVLLTFPVSLLWLPAQDVTGKIEGVLRDPQGGLIPNAQVTVTHLSTGTVRSARSGKAGHFALVLLPIGQYRLSVEAEGFAKYIREPLTLRVNDALDLVIDLKVGAPQEVVQVTSDAPLVETASSTVGKVTSTREILDLPLNGRNFSQLGLLQAGAAPLTQGLAQAGGSLRAGQAYSINGLRPESNNFLIDGARNINNVDSGFALKPPVDSIAEFRILTGGAPPEFGGNVGSNTNLVTRSGGNELHGSVYEFLRNDVFDARNFFSREVEPLKQNQFGATLGGPIRKKRTFFFGYYEGFRNRQGETRTSTVPTALERAGDFSQSVDASGNVPPLMNFLFGQVYPGNKLPPEQINPVSKNLLGYFPLPNNGPNLFTSTEILHSTTDQFGARVDHRLSSRDDLFVRYIFARGESLNPISINGADVPGFPVGDELRTQNILLSETHTFSPSLVNYVRFAYFRNRFNFDQRFNHTPPSDLGFKITSTYEPAVGPPFFQFSGGIAAIGNPITGPRNTLQNSYEVSDSLSWLRGRHNFKFGGEYRRNHVDGEQGIASNSFFVFAPFPVSQPFANFLLGAPVVFFQAGGELPRGLRNHDLALYAQDELHLTTRLTLNLGLRYQVDTPYTEIRNRLAAFRPGEKSQVQPNAPAGLLYPGDPGIPDGLVPVYKKGFGPRVGFSWDPTGSGRMSVRSSYGIYYEGLANGQGGILQAPISAPPYLQARQVGTLFLAAFGIPGPSFADPFPGETNPFPPGNFPVPLTHLTVENDLKPPYVQNWNLSVQRELAQHFLIEGRYVGTKGTRLPRFIEGNPPVFIPGQSTPGNIDQRRIYAGCKENGGPCDFASVGLISGSTNSTYHAMQWTLSRRFAQDYFFSTSYTLSKSLDYVSSLNETGSGPTNIAGENDIPQNPFDRNAEHGPSIFDARHRFVMSGSWELPFFRHASRLPSTVLGNWQVSGIANFSSGTPFTVYDGRDVSQQGRAPEISGFAASRPNAIRDPNQGPRTVERWFDIGAFQRLDPIADAGQFGNAGRNIVRGPGFGVVDLSLLKNIKIRESKQIQFRAECFNIANHANFFIPENDIDSPNFGRILQAGPPRLLQFALKFMF